MASPELEQPIAQLLAPLGTAHADPAVAQDVLERGKQCRGFDVGQVVVDPILDRSGAGGIFVELDREGAHRHSRDRNPRL